MDNVTQERVRLNASEAQMLAEQTLRRNGYDAEEVSIIADHVVDAAFPLDDFRHDMSEIIARVKAAPRQPGVDEIRLPSGRAFCERVRSRKEGIEIDRKISDALLVLSQGTLSPRKPGSD